LTIKSPLQDENPPYVHRFHQDEARKLHPQGTPGHSVNFD